MEQMIQMLSETLMKRIAAGEVIERPASVVKELLENGLDANADSISLIIEEAGGRLIQVVDNGHGMSEADALICIKRHATSKISDLPDLEAIQTMGFRGEALASISSVSRMVITTRTANDEEGTQVHAESGKIGDVLKVAAPVGTNVAVKDLFSAVPARRKFLKSPNTELKHMITAFRRIALSRPEIDFTLFIDGEKTIDLRPGDLYRRITDLFDAERAVKMIKVEEDLGGVRIHGYVSRPGAGYRSQNNQFLYLNRRLIVHRSLRHSIHTAFGSRLGSGEYPAYILFLEMDPQRFDVNVHPTKIEVRFSEDRLVYDVLKRTVLNAFRSPDAAPDLKIIGRNKPGGPGAGKHEVRDFFGAEQLTLDAQGPAQQTRSAHFEIPRTDGPMFWQLHKRYILSQIKSGLTIIDQHVAHERILYEKALLSRKGSIGLSQQLLFSQVVHLDPEDYLTLMDMVPYLEKIGFGLRAFGGQSIMIESVPVDIKPGAEKDLLVEIIQAFKEYHDSTSDIWETVAKAFACKAAIKSGERLTAEQMASLVDQLFASEEPYFCPHGRPIIVNLKLEELDRRFGR